MLGSMAHINYGHCAVPTVCGGHMYDATPILARSVIVRLRTIMCNIVRLGTIWCVIVRLRSRFQAIYLLFTC